MDELIGEILIAVGKRRLAERPTWPISKLGRTVETRCYSGAQWQDCTHADALQTWTRRSWSKDVCTPSVRRASKSRSESRFTSLFAITLARLRRQIRSASYCSRPGCSSSRQHVCVSLGDAVTHLLSKTRHRSLTNPPRISGPSKLACPRPARAARTNVGSNRGLSSRVGQGDTVQTVTSAPSAHGMPVPHS
jgi:hypothetical protein